MLVEKKLRDVTNEEFKSWFYKNCNTKTRCKDCIFIGTNCSASSLENWTQHKEIYNDKFLDSTIEVEQGKILDDVERKYLSAVIKPFRGEIISIQLIHSCYYSKKGWIQIRTPGMNTQLPYCDITKMYLGMTDCKEYTLEELGL